MATQSITPPTNGGGAVGGGSALLASHSRGAGSAAVAPVSDAAAPHDGDAAPGGGAATTAAAAPDGPGTDTSPDAGPALNSDDGAPLSAEAAASPFSPPATERHAAFLKLVDSRAKAAWQDRNMRAADFSALAAEAGAPLFGDDSLNVARLRVSQAVQLSNQAEAEVGRGPEGVAEAMELYLRAWAVLVSLALPVLQRRLDEGTLLPGKLRKVEEAYYVYEQQQCDRLLCSNPMRDAASLRDLSACVGYVAVLDAARTVLNLLQGQLGSAGQRGRAQAFVLAVLRLIPATLGVAFILQSEHNLVDMVECHVTPDFHGASFCAELFALWRSRDVADVLRSRGALQHGVAARAASSAAFASRQAADLAKRGLWRCTLPACGREETTALQFRVCGHCQKVRYCCDAHATQHWPTHKREAREARGGGGAA